MQIEGQILLQVSINGTPFGPQSIPGLQCQILTSKRTHLPELKMQLVDITSTIDSTLPINDGTQISVTVGDSSQPNANPTVFRAFGTPKRSPVPGVSGMTCYTVLGKLDSIPFIAASPHQAFTGTSNSVISQIATANNFKYFTNVSASDSMTWLPGRKTWSQFTDYVCKHAYADSTSAFSWIVNENKTLSYVNIPKLFSGSTYKAYIYYGAPDSTVMSQMQNQAPAVQPTGQIFAKSGSGLANALDDPNSTGYTDPTTGKSYTFGPPFNPNKPKMFTCLDYKAYNRSGVLNTIGAYGMRTTQVALTGTAPKKYLTSDATVNGNSLDVNATIQQAISPVSRMHLMPADTGNSHSNYAQAKHQNRRIGCTYCQNIYALIYQQSGLNVFDYVKFTATTGSVQSKLVSGNYVVTAISRVMWSNRYYEKLELTNNGPSDANSALET